MINTYYVFYLIVIVINNHHLFYQSYDSVAVPQSTLVLCLPVFRPRHCQSRWNSRILQLRFASEITRSNIDQPQRLAVQLLRRRKTLPVVGGPCPQRRVRFHHVTS